MALFIGWILALEFIIDSPSKKLDNGMREWQVGLIIFFSTPFIALYGLVKGSEVIENA